MLHNVFSDMDLYFFHKSHTMTLNQQPLSVLCSRSLITPLDRGYCTQDLDDGSNNTVLLFMHIVIILYKNSTHVLLYPRYEVYRGYIVFACLFVCKLFFSSKISQQLLGLGFLKFGTRLDSDELNCVTKEQPHIANQSLYLFIFLSLQ